VLNKCLKCSSASKCSAIASKRSTSALSAPVLELSSRDHIRGQKYIEIGRQDDGFTLTPSLKLKYDKFAKIVGDCLKQDYLKWHFIRASVHDLKPCFAFGFSNFTGIQAWLAIDHTNKLANKNKTRQSNMEKAIKILK
jgi:hypothetical protein